MSDHVLERRLWLPAPRPEVFGFFADVRNLARVNPPAARPEWLRPPPETLFAGAVIDFRIRVIGLPLRWRVMIREFDGPYRFVDVQLLGPFSRWEHRHRFLETPDGEAGEQRAGTWVEDRVTYRPPLGALGAFAHAAGAGQMIAAMFAYRERRLREIFGEGSGPGSRRNG